MKTLALTCLLSMAAASPAWPQENPSPSVPATTDTIVDHSAGHLYAEIETSKGTIEAELDFQHAPLTSMNFVGLAESTLPFQNRPAGSHFFDGLTFHRVVKDFVIQGGDPLSADPATPADKLGEGGPGYSFPDEFSPSLRHDAAGVLSMANDGPDTNGSQFFITLREVNRLNYLHGAFGQVVHGLEVVNRIEPGDKIERVTIRRVGREAESFVADAKAFETLKKTVLERRHLQIKPDLVYLEDRSGKLPDFRVKNFNYKLANYERTTGHRVAVRIIGEPTDAADKSTREAAKAVGFSDTADNVLLWCSPGDKTWKAWLGEATYPALLGQAGSTAELMASGVMHAKKTALLTAATTQLNADKLKESVDAAVDGTIIGLDDYTLKQATMTKP